MRVLHVTEAMAGGVLTVLIDTTREQVKLGANVSVLYISRSGETPSSSTLKKLFDPSVRLFEITGSNRTSRALHLFRHLREQMLLFPSTVFHLHSSWAGLLGRLVAAPMATRPPVFYSPHGWGFLRTDISSTLRLSIRLCERLLSRIGTVICVSKSEAEAFSRVGSRPESIVIHNGLDLKALHEVTPEKRRYAGNKLRVISTGRLVPQKNPELFARIAKNMGGQADFIWLGGSKKEGLRLFKNGSVAHFPEMPREQYLRQLASADVFVSCARWEGLPMSVLEAQALGIPLVLSSCVGHDDIVIWGSNGFVSNSQGEFESNISTLLGNKALRSEFSGRCLEYANDFELGNTVQRLMRAYRAGCS